MAGTVNLKPEVGMELASSISAVMDGAVLEVIQACYDASRSMGEGNVQVEGMTEKFKKLQEYYNGNLVPSANQAKKSFEEFTDYAEYAGKLQIDTGIRDVEVGQVKPNNYDAAKNL